jgi:hypothetical protein
VLSTVLVIRRPILLVLAIPAFALAAIYFILAKKGPYIRSTIGFTLLALITPATMLAGGMTDVTMIALTWIAVALFAMSSVLVVGVRLEQPSAMRRSAVFHLLYALITIVIVVIGQFPAFIGMASLAIIRYIGVVSESRSYKALPIKTIGIMESILTCASLLLSAAIA